MMTDDALLQILRETEYRCQEGRRRAIRNGLEYLDRSTRDRLTDHTQREAVYRVLNDLSRGTMRKLDETIDVLSQHLQRQSRTSLRDNEKMIRFAQNYGADSATIQRLKQDEISAMMAMTTAGPFANIAAQACKKLATLLTETIPVNQQTIDNAQAALDKAIADKAKADAAADKAENLAYLAKLANATTHLIATIQGGSTAGRSEFVTYRKELAPLAESLGYRIVFIGDRSTAALVSL